MGAAFCIENDEFCIKNDEFCIKNNGFFEGNWTDCNSTCGGGHAQREFIVEIEVLAGSMPGIYGERRGFSSEKRGFSIEK